MAEERGPTGKRKNCDTWAEYEEKGTSKDAALCHGGMWEGMWHQPCPSRYDCAKATHKAQIEKKRRLPLMNPTGVSQYRPRVLMSTELPESLSRLPTYKRHEKKDKEDQPRSYIAGGPIPVQPPDDYPDVMRTPYAFAEHPAAPPLTPVFLPESDREVLPRLMLNMVQGALGAGAQHVMEYTRYVDIFGRRK